MDSWLHAERALLGAMLAGAEGRQQVLGLVRPDDFRRPWHGQVLAAMQRLHRRGVVAGPEQVYAELKSDLELPRSVAHDAVPLAGLLGAAPRTSHAPAYAGIVVGASLRRRVSVCGGRLRQVSAISGGEVIDDLMLDNVRLLVGQERAAAGACRRRWASLPAAMRRQLPVPGRDGTTHAEIERRAGRVKDELARLREDLRAEDSARLAGRLAVIAHDIAGLAAATVRQGHERASRPASPEARPAGAAAEAAGLAALRDLTAAPARIGEIAGWLQPAHFARRDHGEVFAVLTGLHRAGMPVDPVTVSWEAGRRGVQIQPAAVAGGCGAFAPASAAQVYRRAVLARVERAGTDIQAAAADSALPAGSVAEAAGEFLAGLEADLDPGRCSVPRGADVIALRPGTRADRSGGGRREPGAREAVR